MPRMRPPKGYYTMTEAKNILDVSDAMERRYAKKGKIRYLVPEGREQGFYNKQDVDKLSIAINAFIALEDEEERTTFAKANKDDLLGIVKLANSLFSSDKNSNPVVPEWRYMLMEENPETQFVLKLADKVIGFTSILPFKTDTDKWEKMLTLDRVADVGITKGDIESFKPGKHIHLYIAGIGVDKSIEKQKRNHYGAKLVSNLASTIIDLGRRGTIIENITAAGATPIGIRLLLTFGLHEIPPKVPGKRIFTMNMQESGSPLSLKYKQALKESSLLKTQPPNT